MPSVIVCMLSDKIYTSRRKEKLCTLGITIMLFKTVIKFVLHTILLLIPYYFPDLFSVLTALSEALPEELSVFTAAPDEIAPPDAAALLYI